MGTRFHKSAAHHLSFLFQAPQCMSSDKKIGSDSYEGSLSEEKREALLLLVSQPGLSLQSMQKLAPEWVGGQYDGKKPSLETLSNIATRIRTDNMLLQVEATSKMLEAVSGKIRSAGHSTEVLDTALSLIGQEVIQKTLEDSDPKN